MKIRITKIAGGKKLPDGFWVVGEGQTPEATYNVMMAPINDSGPKSMPLLPETTFYITDTVEFSLQTSWGYLFTAGKALWKWEEVIWDNDKWIRD